MNPGSAIFIGVLLLIGGLSLPYDDLKEFKIFARLIMFAAGALIATAITQLGF